MKILVVDPGADWATADVYTGLVTGLKACGQEVVEFRYGRKFGLMSEAYHAVWRKAGRVGQHPTVADAAYVTSELAVTWALRHEPDWMLIVSGMYFHPDSLILARRAGIKTAVLLTESPYDIEHEIKIAAQCDAVWTNERTAVPVLAEVNPQARYLPHAWLPDRHHPHPGKLDALAPAHDVVFVGTGFQERIDLFKGIDWTHIDFGLYGSWLLIPSRSPLRKKIRKGITDNLAAAALYRKAKVNLNLFRTSKGFGRHAPRMFGAESLGPRGWELGACGVFFLSEPRAELTEVYGGLIPTFTSPAELQELLTRWLPDDAGRQAIAARLPAMVRGHSWHERAVQVVANLSASAGRSHAAVTTAVPSSVAPVRPPGMGESAVV